MSTTDGLYLLVEGELVKVTEPILAALIEAATDEDRATAVEILAEVRGAIERIRARQVPEAAA